MPDTRMTASATTADIEKASCLQERPMIDAEPKRELFSIVIPVFNATTTLDQLVQRIAAVFAELPQFDHEIIFVDDASNRPETWPTLKRIALEHGQVRAVQLMRNFGQTSATFCGMKLARGHYIITLDDDLQHAPEDIPLLIAEREHDVVFAQFRELRHSMPKRVLSAMKNLILSFLIDKPKGLQLTSFRLFRRELARAMLSVVISPQATLPPLLFFMTRDVATVQVQHNPRLEGGPRKQGLLEHGGRRLGLDHNRAALGRGTHSVLPGDHRGVPGEADQRRRRPARIRGAARSFEG
jgi:Glycosyl transferase family 2